MSNKKLPIAFLILTYNDHIKATDLYKDIKDTYIYVHPKEPEKVTSILKNKIIDNNFIKKETEWADISIVEAELNLLRFSYKNPDIEWFILLSNSCYPLISINELYNYYLKNNKLSYFLYIKKVNDIIYKSTQFFILNRNDVKIILENTNDFLKIYMNTYRKIPLYGAPDESYLFSLLHYYNKNYKYNNHIVTYSKWITGKNVFVSHPFIINKLTNYDIYILNKLKPFFIRKVTKNFKIKPIKTKKNVNLLYFDITDTKKLKYLYDNQIKNLLKDDIIIFYTDYTYNDEMMNIFINKLIDMSICAINIYYLDYKNVIDTYIKSNKEYFEQWKNVKVYYFI